MTLLRGRRRASTGIFAVLVLALVPSGCATKKDLDELQTEIRRLAESQERAIRELEELTAATRDTVQGQAESLYSLRGETLRLLNQIQGDLSILKELAGQNQRDVAGIRDQLEGGRLGAAAVGGAAGAGVPLLRTDSAGAGEQFTEVQTSAGGAEAMYQAGVRQFNRGSLTTARAAFEEYLAAYPGHEAVPRAHLFLADILVQEDRLEEAVDAFLEIPELFPAAAEVPQALYRAALLELDRGNDGRARELLGRVVDSYPESGAAILAQERLREMG